MKAQAIAYCEQLTANLSDFFEAFRNFSQNSFLDNINVIT